MEVFYTKRLRTRCWEADDRHFALQLWGDKEVTKHISSGGYSETEVNSVLEKQISLQKAFGVQYWFLETIADHTFIGCCGLRPWEFDPAQQGLELGFHIVKSQWRKGYATEAAKGAIDYASGKLKQDKLYAGHHPDNTPSKDLLEKLGFRFEKNVHYPPTGLMHPSYCLSLT